MGVIAAIMTLYDLVKDDIITLDDNSTLLKSINNYILVGPDEQNKHGAYLYYDMNDEKWIRSGKTTGKPFIARHNAHLKAAGEAVPTSRFYRRYPSKKKESTVHCRAGRKGYFENLSLYVALGFTIGDNPARERLTNNVEGESMFYFSEDEISKINQLNKRGQNTWEAKCEDMIAYLIELAFDLAISVLDNVSENPGFESCHGSW